jgi:hypothetical protein
MLEIMQGGIVETDIMSMLNDDNIDLFRQVCFLRESSLACYTIRDKKDKKILCCCGVDLLWPGVGEIWGVFAKDNPRPIETTKMVKWCYEDVLKRFNFHRIHSFVRMDLDSAKKFNEFLGLVPESIAYKFTHDKKDCIVYAMTR